MDTLKNNSNFFPLGFWIAIVAISILLIVGVGGQAYSLINWEKAIELGLQNDHFTGDAVEQTLAIIEKGVCQADMIWLLPLGILAFIGLIKKKFIGFIAGFMFFSIGGYFPIVFGFQRWDTHIETVILAICLFAIPSYLGIVGLWLNRKYFCQRLI